MDELAQITRALENVGAHSSDYDLNPEILGALPKARKLRPAAVLVGLIPRAGGLHMVLTQRPATMQHHPAQVAFPGGKVDAIDASHMHAALREAEEEIGLPEAQVRILGALPRHETVTGFTVTPFVGLIDAGFTPHPDPTEVAEVFCVPLVFFTRKGAIQVHSRFWNGVERRYLAAPYGPHYIWGATARMIKGLVDAMEGA